MDIAALSAKVDSEASTARTLVLVELVDMVGNLVVSLVRVNLDKMDTVEMVCLDSEVWAVWVVSLALKNKACLLEPEGPRKDGMHLLVEMGSMDSTREEVQTVVPLVETVAMAELTLMVVQQVDRGTEVKEVRMEAKNTGEVEAVVTVALPVLLTKAAGSEEATEVMD